MIQARPFYSAVSRDSLSAVLATVLGLGASAQAAAQAAEDDMVVPFRLSASLKDAAEAAGRKVHAPKD